MRIPQITLQAQTLTDLNATLGRLQRSQSELASGLRISQPSDDPYGSSLALTLDAQGQQLTTYQSNISDGTSWLTVAQSGIQSITAATQRVRELAVEAANGTASATDRAGLAAEVSQLIDGIKAAGNAQYAGSYVFAGTATTTPPWQVGGADAYAGDSGVVNHQIGSGVQVPISTDLNSVLGSAGGDGKLLDTLRKIAADMSSGTTAGQDSLRTTDLGSLDTSMASVTTLAAQVGASLNRMQFADSRMQDLQFVNTKALSGVQDADMAQTAIAFSTEQASYQAALQASAKILQQSLLNFLN